MGKKRAAQNRSYKKLRLEYLAANPICEVWLKEHGFEKRAPRVYGCPGKALLYTAEHLIEGFNAPRATQIHHKAKRRGAMLCDVRYFLAVCERNHRRIEENLSWAREQGFSLNF